MNNRKQDDFLKSINNSLDEGLDKLDPDTLAQLQARRRQALCQTTRPRPWLYPASGLALATGLGVLSISLLWQAPPIQTQTQQIIMPSFMDDLELLSSGDELELYQELEFYQWLEREHERS